MSIYIAHRHKNNGFNALNWKASAYNRHKRW